MSIHGVDKGKSEGRVLRTWKSEVSRAKSKESSAPELRENDKGLEGGQYIWTGSANLRGRNPDDVVLYSFYISFYNF